MSVHEHLSRLDDILELHQPYLVVVAVDPKVDKTTLLQQVRMQSVELGWSIVPTDLQAGLRVVPDTSESTFCSDVLELFDTPADDTRTLGDTRQAESFLRDARVGTAADEAAQLISQTYRSPHYLLIDRLSQQQPVLLLFDSYQPNPAFAEWFMGTFVEDIKHARVTVVMIIIADKVSDLVTLSPWADEFIPYRDSLDVQMVKMHLELLGRRITPPMTEAELNAYVEAVREDPQILSSLASVLTLTRLAKQPLMSHQSYEERA